MILASIIFMHSNAFSMNSAIGNQINTIILNHGSNINESTSENLKNQENRFAFVLFYMGTCPHCQRFDPVLKAFSSESHIPVLPYTLDAKALPSFPNSFTPTRNEIQKFFPTDNPVVPILFLMDQKTRRIYPMIRGEATGAQLSQRFNQLQHSILNDKVNMNNEQDFDS